MKQLFIYKKTIVKRAKQVRSIKAKEDQKMAKNKQTC